MRGPAAQHCMRRGGIASDQVSLTKSSWRIATVSVKVAMDLGHVILLQSPILRVAAIWLEPQALTRDSLRFRKTGCALCPCNLAFTVAPEPNRSSCFASSPHRAALGSPFASAANLFDLIYIPAV